jgi:alkylhydroperoxidase/carboxymuconolactone decarboxylase family protein
VVIGTFNCRIWVYIPTNDERRIFDMSGNYYESRDLADFANIAEYAPEQGSKFFEYYAKATSPGALTEREKALIALAVAMVRHCPYCIDAYTNKCLSLGVSHDEMMEAVHVGAAMTAGDVLAHATQMRKIIKKKEM